MDLIQSFALLAARWPQRDIRCAGPGCWG